MLTYNSTTHVSYLFKDDSADSSAQAALEVLGEGGLVKAKSSFLALPIKEATPGIAHDDFGEVTQTGLKHYLQFSPQHNLLIVKKPTWCECPKHLAAFSKRPEWTKQHLGYVSLIFLHGETLFEAITHVQKDEGIGKELLKFVSSEFLAKHPELVFIPLLEPARV